MSVPHSIIFHIDGDAFFASCEQSTQLSLRGRPIAVGKERGVATAFSYEAKALGVTRGMSGRDIARDFPEVLLVSSDYRKYSLFSRRMKRIVKTYSPLVETSSIDECYADMSSVVQNMQEAYKLATLMQEELCTKLGLTVSIGIGSTKTIAKLASGMNKPRGITLLSNRELKQASTNIPITKVCGVGWRMEARMHSKGIYTIADFTSKSVGWIRDNFHKPHQELYRELRGVRVKSLELTHEPPKSISKIRAFTPASSNRELLLSEFARNAEIIATKLHREQLLARRIKVGMKMQMHRKRSCEIVLDQGVQSAGELITLVEQHFCKLYRSGEQYRATYIAVYDLGLRVSQGSLFAQDTATQKRRIQLDDLHYRMGQLFGVGMLTTAGSLLARRRLSAIDITDREGQGGTPLILSASRQQILSIPYLGTFT